MKNFLIISLVVVIYILITALPLEIVFANFDFIKNQAEYVEEIIKNFVIVAIAIVVIIKLDLSNIAGISKKPSLDNWYLILIPTYLIFIGLLQIKDIDFSRVSASDWVLLLASTLSIGFSEELVFRGLLQSLFIRELLTRRKTKSAIFLSVLLPATIFGLLHLLNFRIEYAASEISQLLYAIFIGTAFGAILLRTNRIIPLAIIHGLIDFVFNLDELALRNSIQELASTPEPTKSIINAVATLIVVAPLFIAGLLTIKKVKLSDLSERLCLTNDKLEDQTEI